MDKATYNNLSFPDVYDKYVDVLFNYGCCITQDRELVKDCIHDVFAKYYIKSREQEISNLNSYLFISLRNRLFDEFRRSSFSCEDSLDKVVFRISDDDVEADLIDDESVCEEKSQVAALLDVLTPRQKEAITLYYIQEKKYTEICEIMGLNYHSIRNLVHRGMVNMRKAVE